MGAVTKKANSSGVNEAGKFALTVTQPKTELELKLEAQ